MSSILGYYFPTMRGIAQRLKLETVAQIAQRPGVQAVYRVTVHYYDGRACDSVTTLCKSVADGITLDIRFQNALGGKPLTQLIAPARFEEFVKALWGIGFDHMRDEPLLTGYRPVDVWLVERAAGGFVHGVILAPELAKDNHARLVNAIRNGLPEALRIVK
jgi:hypothetical protein